MIASQDPKTIIGFLECDDGTAAVMGKPHTRAKRGMAIPSSYSTIRLTREAGEALYEMLGEWLGDEMTQTNTEPGGDNT